MSRFVPRRGTLLCLPDSDEDRSVSGILFPDDLRRKRTSVTCLIHNPSDWWLWRSGDGEITPERLDGLRLLVEKWNWHDINLGEQTFYLIPERAVFATIDEEQEDMNRTELIATLKEHIEDIVTAELPTDEEVSQENLDNIQAALESTSVDDLVTEAEDAPEDGEE